MAFTQTTINIKDADGVETPMLAYDTGTEKAFARPVLDNTGAIISPATAGLQATANTSLGAIATSVAAGATAAAQATGNTSLATIATNTTGAATAALQSTGNTSLVSILTAVQAATPAGSNVIGGVTIADGSDAAVGAKADAAASTDTGTFGLIALKKRSLQTLTSILSAVQAAIPAGTNLIGKVGIDQTTPGTTNLVYLPPPLIVTGATTTRPADTSVYTAGDLLANNTAAGSVTFPVIAAARGIDIAGTILRLRLKKSGTTLTNGIFRVHLYNVQPSVTNGDNGVWLSTTAGYVGCFDVTMTQAFSDSAMGIGVPVSGSGVNFAPATGTQNLYYLIEVRAGYTPISAEVFTPYVEVQ